MALQARGVTSAHSFITDGGSSNGAAGFVSLAPSFATLLEWASLQGPVPFKLNLHLSLHVQ